MPTTPTTHVTSTEPRPDIFADRPDDPMSEALLLQAVRDGSTAAFGILYARYRSLAVGVATQALPQADITLAEDVAEVSFIRVLTALRNGKGPTDTLRSYLATTVRREAWRAQRRRRRQAEVVERWAVGEERAVEPDPDPGPSPEPGDDLGSHVLLGEAFRGLSDRWRHVLWLTAVEGRKPAEVAPMLGVSAGSASALAYRARNGLIAAYVAAYRRSTDDEACVAISGDLERYVAAGTPDTGFEAVVAHIEGCPSCRDLSRGVDVLGSVLASMAPFGLLTAGWWAKAAGLGASGLAGGAAAAGTLGAAQGLGGSTAAATGATATGGMSIGGAVAAAAAVAVLAVLAGATWFGVVRSDADGSETAAAPPAASAPDSVQRPRQGSVPVATEVDPPAVRPGPAAPASSPSRPAAATSTTVARSTVPSAGPTSVPPVPSTTSPVPSTTTATTKPSTTTTQPPVVRTGSVSGRAFTIEGEDGTWENPVPVGGITVVAYDDAGELVASSTTGADGRWSLRTLPRGHYLVVAVVPAAYRPATGPDPWSGGATWGTILGSVDLGDQALDLVDLRLVDR